MKKLITGCGLLIALSCLAQSTPELVKTAFAKQFPGVVVKKWDKEEGKFEANFSKDGKIMSAVFTANGKLEETETDIDVAMLPVAIKSYVKAKYKGATIKEAAQLIRNNKTLYEAEVKGNDLLFDENGNFVSEEED